MIITNHIDYIAKFTSKYFKEKSITKEKLFEILNANKHLVSFDKEQIKEEDITAFIQKDNKHDCNKVISIIMENNRNENYYNKIAKSFDPNEVYLINLVSYSKRSFGVKVQILDQVYLFDFNGTVDELIEELESELDGKKSDYCECPYCKHQELFSTWYGINKCPNCNAYVIHEQCRPNILSTIIDEIGGMLLITYGRDHNWKIWFIDSIEKVKLFDEIVSGSIKDDHYFENYINTTKYTDILSSDIGEIKEISDTIKIDKNLIFKVINEVCEDYCFWILAVNKNFDKYLKIKKYEYISEWIDDNYGENFYNEDKNKYYNNFDDELYNTIEQHYSLYIKKLFNVDEYDDIDEKYENEIDDVKYHIRGIIYDYFNKLSTIQCWKDFQVDVVKGIEEARKERLLEEGITKKRKELAKKTIELYFPEFKKSGKIDRQNSKDLFEKLIKVLPVLSDEVILSLEKYPPTNYLSKSVVKMFTEMVDKFIRKRKV